MSSLVLTPKLSLIWSPLEIFAAIQVFKVKALIVEISIYKAIQA